MAASSTALTRKATTPDRDIDGLEHALGHRFSDRELLKAALRHSSVAPGAGRARARTGDNFERFEFLGDRVVGLVVADLLLARYPREPEGDVARRHATLVSRRVLAEIAVEMDLGRYLRLTRGEEVSGGRDKPTVLADALEAVIGALYRDGGLDAASRLVSRLFETRLDGGGKPPRDPKTALQEWAQARGLPLPVYRTVKMEGPAHQPSFQIEVTVKGFDPVVAGGTSKRDAERAAAAALIEALPKQP
jgi:ribonuclease III